jgi:hypothetical protein
MSQTDKQVADRVLQILTTARYLHASAAVLQIDPLREQVGSGGSVERERADAWLAICALYDALRTAGRGTVLDPRWDKAIEKTTVWSASIK